MAILVKLRYQDEPRKLGGERAEEEQHTWLVLYNREGKVVGRLKLDEVDGWWSEEDVKPETF